MHTWTAFTAEQPELAGRARAIVGATTNAVLGTIRTDGSPRLSGIDPFFVEDELWLGSMPGARKGADIARDPRIALHSVPWESRPPVPEGEDLPTADVKVSARAVRVTDADRQAEVMAAFAADRGFDTDEAGPDADTDPAAQADTGADRTALSDANEEAGSVDDKADLFAIDLVSVVVTGVANDQLVIEHWSPTTGLTITRRS